jgi:hypothetical protein
MILIRQEQLAAFERAARERRIDELIASLFDEVPRSVRMLPPPLLRSRVELALGRAEERGLRRAGSVQAFVTLMFAVAPDFDAQEAIRAVLDDEALTPDQRMRALETRVTPDDWAEAAKGYRDAAWGTASLAAFEAARE